MQPESAKARVAASRHELVGYFTTADQTTPAYDPPHDAPCLVCWRPLTPDDIRTVSLMPVGHDASLFFRVHRTCAEHDPAAVEEIESAIVDGEFPRPKYRATGAIVPLYDADLNPINRDDDDA